MWYSQRTAASRGLNFGFAALQTREHKPDRKPSTLWIHRTSRKEGYVLGVGFVAHGGMGAGSTRFALSDQHLPLRLRTEDLPHLNGLALA